MKEKLAVVVRQSRGTLDQAAERAGGLVREATAWTTQTFEAYRPTEEQLTVLWSAARKGSKVAADAAAALAKDVLSSRIFKDAAKGAGAGAVIAVPLPLVGPLIGSLVGAGVGVYVGFKVSRPSGSAGAQTVEVVATPVRDLAEALRSLDDLRRDGVLTDEEFDALKQKALAAA